MLQQATYTRDGRTLTATVERSDVLLQSEDILNFPRLIELEGDRLVLPYGRGRHGGSETRPVALSDNFGKTWADAPAGSPWADNVQTSGILGYLNDGSIAYIDVFPANVSWSKPEDGPYHRSSAGKVSDPVFRLRRFSRQGDLIEEGTLKLEGLPWDLGSYENYGTLLELENGDLLTAFEAQVGYPSEERFNFTTFVGRSTDGGKTFHHVHTFDPETPDGGVGDEGFCEPDMEVLANGDILCMMRTGGRSPMYQSRSTDGGHTWSEPESVGWQGVKPHLRLLSNGVLACSAGRGAYGFPQVTHAMFSIDGTGEHWEYPLAFHTGPGCSYTSNMERNGKFYVAYSHSSFTRASDTYELPYHAIEWAVIDVEVA